MANLPATIETSVVESMKSPSLIDLTLEVGEVAIDSLLDDGLAKDIPFFGLIMKANDAVTSISARIFAAKIYKFLKVIGQTSKEERDRVIDDISRKKGGTEAAGTAILDLIDRLDSEKKPEFVGKLFNACARRDIAVDEYLRLADIISKVYLKDIELLSDPHPGGLATSQQKNIFMANGLMIMGIKNPSRGSESGANMLKIASDIYEKPFDLAYKLTRSAAQISLHCFGLDRFSDRGIEGFVS
ncbi:hypothetical protein GUV64_11290 [Stenotrophomonas maltophilia]|uniref:hypothetical protein n=1 Tax=Stenotrophomonas maltophilia TaxID=40324 RepID=UPI001F449829|nr:hypothetical protein [Stenotrophomonas maltophilia]MCF3537235.1 hypothetical protein [Stenotrophomonas maltophilia]